MLHIAHIIITLSFIRERNFNHTVLFDGDNPKGELSILLSPDDPDVAAAEDATDDTVKAAEGDDCDGARKCNWESAEIAAGVTLAAALNARELPRTSSSLGSTIVVAEDILRKGGCETSEP